MTDMELPLRIESKIRRTSSCWFWTGAKNDDGYGYVIWEGKVQPAHRVVWLILVGPLDPELTLDHDWQRCGHHDCVNPDHLEEVTEAENIRRAWQLRALKTHCSNNHPLTGNNLYVSPMEHEDAGNAVEKRWQGIE